jgi:diguanylate cyclase (GGDEF)-like protein
MLVAARPVLTSDNQGPIKASLIMGRYLDASAIAELEAITSASFSVYALGDSSMPPDVSRTAALLTPGGPAQVEPVDGSTLAGYSVIEDITGTPALYVRVLSERRAYAQGREAAWYLLGALALAGGAFMLVTMLLLERTVLAPLARLDRQVGGIAGHGSRSARVSEGGRDELGRLAMTINSFLDTIERADNGRDRAEAQLIALNRELANEREAIAEINRSLEEKVRQRTDALELLNDQLQQRHTQLQDARAQATTDALTGLGNHRAFQQIIRDAVKAGGDVGLAIIDIDNFKAINDQRGHLVGDQVLRDFSAALMELGMADRAYRYGGDEFAIVLPGEGQTAAVASAEQIRIAVQQRLDGVGNVTVSVGAASYPETADAAEELIYGADAAMYWAKSAGKNRVGNWGETRRQSASAGRTR